MYRIWRLVSGLVIAVCLFVDLLPAQQWERLPLNGGHFDRFWTNPLNERVIFACTQNKDLYRSVDRGLHWTRITNEAAPFKRTYLDMDFDAKGRIYLLTIDGLWRSMDNGVSWELLPVSVNNEYLKYSQIAVSADGIIMIWNSQIDALFRSMDEGHTWKEIHVPGDAFIKTIYQDAADANFIALLAYESSLISFDGGKQWAEHDLPSGAFTDFAIDINYERDIIFRYATGINPIHIYQSNDTCKTWTKMTGQPVSAEDGALSGPAAFQLISMNDSTIMLNRSGILFRSIDSGRNFVRISDPVYYNILRIGDSLLGSVSMTGILLSADHGDTWDLVPGQPEILNFAEAEFVHAHDDTMFVLLSDGWRPGDRTSWFLESVDGGMSWRKLFDSRIVYDLSVDAGRPARYYLLAAVSLVRWSIVTGTAGQSKPDTIHTYNPNWHPWDMPRPKGFSCFPSRRFPGHVYASKNNATIGVSSDRGTTWEWSSVGLGLTDVRPWASQIDPYRIVVSGSTKDWNYTDREGIYFTATGGSPFEFMNANSELAVYAANMYVNPDDRYFLLGVPDSGSFDYGRTWETIRDGLDPGTTIRYIYQSHGEVLLWTDTGIYCFRDDRWQHLRTPEGAPLLVEGPWELRRSTPVNVQAGDDYIYALAPGYGVYRTRLGPLTGVATPPDIRGTGLNLELFPNPAAGDLTIRWSGNEGSIITISILDLLGREVWRWTGDGSVGSRVWSGRRVDASPLPAGVYFIQLLSGQEFDVATMILQ